ncbi:enoyl-CoA hydratase/isomerase family protein [Mycobacterium sp. SM1]|uniref:enoyl-CoA hydratase-related protein n=1 Tax=Mycobacterium sp. SM1 TaxID=2816243 RepID=UPI001BD00E9F|nr:enoyl-CoA hydratase-related protein [Mycobacterium sp. SM1]MBS4728928.1 enoyl-CoA hydratase/isomerase family protein [Mycobacterium sp. SM1]
MSYRHITVDGDRFVTICMNRPERRNALSLDHMLELIDAFRVAGASDCSGVILAGAGPVFCAGHDFADMVGQDLGFMRHLLGVCAELMASMQSIRQPVIAKVQGLATAAGCQLVCSCDLAVASTEAGFALPGGKGGWFCHTPLVAVARSVERKRALEMAFTGDPIDAHTALQWGMVNRVVPPDQLDAATTDLLARATRGSFASKALGKAAFYAQVDLDQPKAYAHAVEVMAAASQLPDAREAMAAFLEKRPAVWAEPTALGHKPAQG